MTRAEWQRTAEERLLAARSLLVPGYWSSAYYLAGYAVECGLKSCILARVAASPEILFEDKKYSEKCWTHNLDDLLRLAGIETQREIDGIADAALGANWNVVRRWNERSRYERAGEMEARSLCNALSEPAVGLMQWIRPRW